MTPSTDDKDHTLISEFAFVPEEFEAGWRGSFGGYTDEESVEILEYLAAAVDYCFNPPDNDVLITLLTDTLLGAATFIASLPCTCSTPGDDDGPCDRCSALGRWHNERVER